jgi:hypothetical protein
MSFRKHVTGLRAPCTAEARTFSLQWCCHPAVYQKNDHGAMEITGLNGFDGIKMLNKKGFETISPGYMWFIYFVHPSPR